MKRRGLLFAPSILRHHDPHQPISRQVLPALIWQAFAMPPRVVHKILFEWHKHGHPAHKHLCDKKLKDTCQSVEQTRPGGGEVDAELNQLIEELQRV